MSATRGFEEKIEISETSIILSMMDQVVIGEEEEKGEVEDTITTEITGGIHTTGMVTEMVIKIVTMIVMIAITTLTGEITIEVDTRKTEEGIRGIDQIIEEIYPLEIPVGTRLRGGICLGGNSFEIYKKTKSSNLGLKITTKMIQREVIMILEGMKDPLMTTLTERMMNRKTQGKMVITMIFRKEETLI